MCLPVGSPCGRRTDYPPFPVRNDHYGHPKGDECLRAVGGALNSLRDELDIYTARLGGEEFAVLWFEKDRNGVNNVISRMQRLIEDLNIPHVKSTVSECLTVSIGICITRCGEGGSVQEIYASADNALYEAKANGRNRVVVFGEEMTDLYRQK
jgi:diguanylate cyclase (GGDEF)-like protein